MKHNSFRGYTYYSFHRLLDGYYSELDILDIFDRYAIIGYISGQEMMVVPVSVWKNIRKTLRYSQRAERLVSPNYVKLRRRSRYEG